MQNSKSEILCLIIVSYRTLNINKDKAIEAMQILKQRELNGDLFDYNSYIEEKIKTIPKSTIDENKSKLIKTILKNVKSGTF